MSPLVTVVVTVGTDHHRFDRLTDWLEPWVARHPEVRVVHQHGSSRPAKGAEAVRLVPREQMLALQREATVVVSQGGPGSILDARLCGRLPVVVPRVARLHEVVDDHQVHFCERLSGMGWVRGADTPENLHALLDQALVEPTAFRCVPHVSPAPATALRIAEELDAIGRSRPGFVSWRRLRTVLAGRATVVPALPADQAEQAVVVAAEHAAAEHAVAAADPTAGDAAVPPAPVPSSSVPRSAARTPLRPRGLSQPWSSRARVSGPRAAGPDDAAPATVAAGGAEPPAGQA